MRTLTLVFITLWLVGCNAKDPDDDEPDTLVADATPTAPAAPVQAAGAASVLPTHLMMETKVVYAQPGLDFTKTLTLAANSVSVKLPDTIDVVSGNAGNSGLVRLTLPNGSCDYKGAASVASPLSGSNLIEIEKGRKLNFYHCYDASMVQSAQVAGDSVTLGSLTAKILVNGDTAYPEMTVRVFLEVQ